MRRTMSVNGAFYPAECTECETFFENFNNALDVALGGNALMKLDPKILIVPHAGYVYSGYTANIAYRLLKESHPKRKRAIVIGPSHRVYLSGKSGSAYQAYETPCGVLPIDLSYLNRLKENFSIQFLEEAHYEHSTEVQMPFLKYYFPDISVIEFVYGKEKPEELAEMIKFLVQDSENVVIISTDLSHFHPEKEANKLDSICIRAIDTLDRHLLHEGCEACGMTGVEASIIAANALHLQCQILNYQTSAETSHDRTSVVGYLSAVMY